jgi:hypothetical protein
MEPICNWSGEARNAPDWNACHRARTAILDAASGLLPAKKARPLENAVKILDKRRPRARVGKDLKKLCEKASVFDGVLQMPHLERIFQIALESRMKGDVGEKVKLRQEFLTEISAYQKRLISRKECRKTDEENFKRFDEFLPYSNATCLAGKFAEMLFVRTKWLDQWHWPMREVIRFLADAGFRRPDPIDEYCRKSEAEEHAKNEKRTKDREKKKRERAEKPKKPQKKV